LRIFGLILAGGSGQRLGMRDKALVSLAGTVLVARAIARLAPQADAVAISANGDPARFAAFGLSVIDDGAHVGEGPLAGVLAGLRWAGAAGADGLVTVAVDTPFFPMDLVRRLVAAGGWQDDATRVPVLAESGQRVHPTFALWPVGAAGFLSEALARGERRLRVAAQGLGGGTAVYPAGADPFFNINTEQDLAQAEHRLAAGGDADIFS